jgi:hypothetical protein
MLSMLANKAFVADDGSSNGVVKSFGGADISRQPRSSPAYVTHSTLLLLIVGEVPASKRTHQGTYACTYRYVHGPCVYLC